MKCYLSYLLGITLLIVNFINASAVPSNADAEQKDTNDKYYLIYVNNSHGEYKLYSDGKNQKREEPQVFVDSLVDEINSLILKNKNTYKNPERLAEIEEGSLLSKRQLQNGDSGLVYPISSIDDTVVLYAYLSDELSKKISDSMEDVSGVYPNKASVTLQHTSFNVEEILAETGWKDVGVQENADYHLSILSQGKYDYKNPKKFDTNYYYPASAGKGIDIVILDSNFDFNNTEFSNTDERTIRCGANVANGIVSTENLDNYCGKPTELLHGETVSDMAGGLVHGTASLANIIGVSVTAGDDGEIKDADVLAGLQYIYENLVRPHKTVINISMAGITYGESEYYKTYGKLVDGITAKGGIIVAAAGNSGFTIGKNYGYTAYPCQFNNVICIGGINNTDEKDKFNLYTSHDSSNYGDAVDFYAPFVVISEVIYKGKQIKIRHNGTSFSSPLVAGMIATLMSENPEIEYTKDLIYKQLKENGKDLKVTHLFAYGSGIMANNGKRTIYFKDEEAKKTEE